MADSLMEWTSQSGTERKTLDALRLYLITDRSLLPEDGFLPAIEAALQGGVRAIQLREKNLPEAELVALAKQVLELTRKHDALLIINHRADVAEAIGADGVHLTEASASVRRIRKQYPGLLMGKSTHSLEGAMRAEKQGADFVTFSPVYDTPSKHKFGPAQGLDKLEQVTKHLTVPVLALGGIDLSRITPVRKHGAFGIALIRGIWNSSDIEKESIKYIQALTGETL